MIQQDGVHMTYIPPFKVVCGRMTIVTVNGQNKINNSYDEFVEVIKLLLRGFAFDETWYLSKNTDVAEAVAAGTFKSGRHHFIEVGYFEGRRPCDFEVDEKWYLESYPDVADNIGKGEIKSARWHFNQYGYNEGRLPSEL
jgi:hypothetical protein